jgi:hypothetical protein
MEISDGNIYPELYLAKYSFDASHLNNNGAVIYSAIIGEKLNDLEEMNY